MKLRRIFSLKLASRLMQHGFKCINEEQNIKFPEFKVFVFEATDEFNTAVKVFVFEATDEFNTAVKVLTKK